MVLVSLKRVIFFNVNGITILLDSLKKIRKDMNVTIGFCDYKEIQYETIKRFFKKELNFSLYKTFRIATLFNNPSENEESILVWNSSYEQRNLQTIELYERGYNPIVVQKKSEFQEQKKKREAYDEIIYDSHLGVFGSTPFARVSGNAIIYTLHGYLDATIETKFDFIYHNNSLQIGFKLFIFDMKNIISMNVRALDFYEKLTAEAEKYKANVVLVNFKEGGPLDNFRRELERVGVKFIKDLDSILNDKPLLEKLGGISQKEDKKARNLTRVLINQLPSFIKATAATLEMMTGLTAKKHSPIKIKDLTVEDIDDKLASSIGFYGDIEGIIILVFPKNIAKKSCSIMVGEDIDSINEVLDTLAEFVNVIAGRVKYHLSEQDINVSITLPRTYPSMEDLYSALNVNKGVQVDLNFDDEIFTFFLTR
jgi:CheY-specific phosphatase CheX